MGTRRVLGAGHRWRQWHRLRVRARACAEDGAVVTICGRTADKLDAAADSLRERRRRRGRAHDHGRRHRRGAGRSGGREGDRARRRPRSTASWRRPAARCHMGPLVLADVEAVRATLDLNVISTFLMLKHSAKRSLRRGEGRSSASRRTPAATRSGSWVRTAPPKAGLDMMVRVAADELGGAGVRVNSVPPGRRRHRDHGGDHRREPGARLVHGGDPAPAASANAEEIAELRAVPHRARVGLDHGPEPLDRRRAVGAQGRRLRRVRRGRAYGTIRGGELGQE